MTKAIWRFLAGSLLVGCSVVASAQYTAKKIVFSDMGPYSQADLEDLVGIHVGQAMGKADLDAAVQKISDSSFFEDVTATVDGPFKGVTVLFKVKPVSQSVLVKASFDNFVWFTPEELAAAIHAQVPVFRGYLPVSGATVDKAAAGLNAALAAKGIAGQVTYANFEPAFGHPERVVQFAVVRRAVVMKTAELTGVSAGMQAVVQKQVQALTGRRYSEGLAGTTTVEALLTPYLDAGYIDAKLTGVERTAAETAQRTEVTVKATVEEGAVWRISSVAYAGSEVFSAADFVKRSGLKAEDVASRKALRLALLPIDTAYRNRGYLDAVADVTATRDEATHQVAYTVTETPGAIYKVRTVTPLGLSAGAQQEFDSAWKMKAGEVYSPAYVATFLLQTNGLKALNAYAGSFKASADPETHLVDLTVTFVAAGR